MDSSANIAFIGIGRMGFQMAHNIRHRMPPTSTLFIFDVVASACTKFTEEHQHIGPIVTVGRAREAARNAEVVISMVPGPGDVRKVYLDETDGIIAAEPKDGRLFLECSTIDSATTRAVGEEVMRRVKGVYVDAPVSGGVIGAQNAKLSIMVGCPKESPGAARIKSILSMMGSEEKIFFCGDLGTGVAAKISNNYLAGTVLVAVAEAMAVGIRSGVDSKVLHDVIHNSSGQTWMGDTRQPVPGVVAAAMSSQDYKPSFKHELMVKDLSLGVDAGQKTGIETSMAKTAVEHYREATKDPKVKDLDISSIYLRIMENAKKE